MWFGYTDENHEMVRIAVGCKYTHSLTTLPLATYIPSIFFINEGLRKKSL